MKSKFNIICLILLSCIKLFSSITIDEINIESEFYEAFSKNTVEFIFHNDNDSSSRNGYIGFRLNSSAIISKFWLEIDNKLVQDETFRIDSGSKIYNKIKNEKNDPAILRKYDHLNHHTISVFPCNTGEKKRVVVEYYSVLETINNQLTWLFEVNNFRYRTNKDSTIINFKARTNMPNQTIIETNNSYLNFQNEKEIALSSINRLNFHFQLPKNDSNIFYKNERIPYKLNGIKETMLEHSTSKRKQVKYCPKIPSFIDEFIFNYEETDYLIYESVKTDTFLVKFLNYINTNFPENSTYNQLYSNWFTRNDSIYYIDDNLTMIAFKSTNQMGNNNYIECPFLDTFIEYNDLMNLDYQEQIKSNYLTRHNVKVVLEKNEKNERLKKEVLESERKYKPVKFRTSRFSVYEDAPVIVKRVEPLYTNNLLNYLNIEGRCYIEVEVLKSGRLGEISIKKSLHPILDYLAIYAVKQWDFKPAKSANQPVSVWHTMYVDFSINYDNIEKSPPSENSFYLFNRELKEADDMIYEVNFLQRESTSMKLYSDLFFNLILNNPDLIEIYYFFSLQDKYTKLGLQIDKQKFILIEK